MQLRVRFLGVLFLGSQSFSAHRGRWLRERRVRRYVQENGVRCILRGLRLRERVRWGLVRERDFRLRDRLVREAVLAVRRDDLDSDMCREA
jgi:hypothetical protein